jgi:hypothetical protein
MYVAETAAGRNATRTEFSDEVHAAHVKALAEQAFQEAYAERAAAIARGEVARSKVAGREQRLGNAGSSLCRVQCRKYDILITAGLTLFKDGVADPVVPAFRWAARAAADAEERIGEAMLVAVATDLRGPTERASHELTWQVRLRP